MGLLFGINPLQHDHHTELKHSHLHNLASFTYIMLKHGVAVAEAIHNTLSECNMLQYCSTY